MVQYALNDLSSSSCLAQSYGQVVRSPDSTMFESEVLPSNPHSRGGTGKEETVSGA